MTQTKPHTSKSTRPAGKPVKSSKQAKPAKRPIGAKPIGSLGIVIDDVVHAVKLVRAGFSYEKLAEFQKSTCLTWSEISRFVAIPERTLSRRQNQGHLQADESDRLLRASAIFDMAVDLFEGDRQSARTWLISPQPGLGGETPLDFASTQVGAREVENLIGRLEHGVFI